MIRISKWVVNDRKKFMALVAEVQFESKHTEDGRSVGMGWGEKFENLSMQRETCETTRKHELLEFRRMAAILYKACSFIICKTLNL